MPLLLSFIHGEDCKDQADNSANQSQCTISEHQIRVTCFYPLGCRYDIILARNLLLYFVLFNGGCCLCHLFSCKIHTKFCQCQLIAVTLCLAINTNCQMYHSAFSGCQSAKIEVFLCGIIHLFETFPGLGIALTTNGCTVV